MIRLLSDGATRDIFKYFTSSQPLRKYKAGDLDSRSSYVSGLEVAAVGKVRLISGQLFSVYGLRLSSKVAGRGR